MGDHDLDLDRGGVPWRSYLLLIISMFGNHPLPNIDPSLPFHPPPPSSTRRRHCPRRSPRECPNGPSEGALVVTDRHVTAAANPARHVTADDEHQPRLTTTKRPADATSRPKQARHDTSPPQMTATCPASQPLTTTGRHVTANDGCWPVTTAASPLLEGCRRRNRRVEERGGGEWSEGPEEWGLRGRGKGGGQEGARTLPPALFSYVSVSNEGSVCCPLFLSVPNGGQHTLLPFIFISNGGSMCCPVSFHFELSNGGSVFTPPPFFQFRTGAA